MFIPIFILTALAFMSVGCAAPLPGEAPIGTSDPVPASNVPVQVPTPTPEIDIQSTVEAMVDRRVAEILKQASEPIYVPTVQDFESAILPRIGIDFPEFLAEDMFLSRFDEFAGTYMATECLKKGIPSASRFREFVKSIPTAKTGYHS